MILVGNIVSNEELVGVPNNFVQGRFISTNGLPTLVIGWELTKSLYPQASILKKEITDNVFWTFSKSEKRTIFEKDLNEFIKKSYEDYVKNIKHTNIDPIIYKIKDTEELINKIKAVAGDFAYLYVNKVVYVYNNFNIFSIDLEQLDFIGFDKEKVLNELEENIIYFEKKNKLINFKDELKYLNIKYIPYLMFKDATKNITSSLIHQN